MKYIAFIKANLNKIKHYKVLNILNVCFVIIGLLMQLAVYDIFINSNNNIDLWPKILVYVFLAGYLNIIMSIYRVPEFSNKITDGSYAVYSIRPISYVAQFSLIEFGESLNGMIIGLPLFLITISIAIYKNIHLYILQTLLIMIFSIILSILMTINMYSITIFTKKNSAPKALFQGLSSLLSGSLVPIILWPEKLSRMVKVLPFALIINAPIEVSLGNQSVLETVILQLIWIIIFLITNKVFIERILSKQEHIGG